MNRNGRAFLRLAVAVYVIYLGVSLISSQLQGKSAMGNGFACISAAVLILGGVTVGIYAVRSYLREKAADSDSDEETQNTMED